MVPPKSLRNLRAPKPKPTVSTNPVPNPDFRPNTARSVYLSGPIGQETLDRLTPEILRLQASRRDPITLVIDSPGGQVRAAMALIDLLRATNQDGAPRCRIITLVTGVAASSAADLLATGDYALAYSRSLVLCHGVRQGADTITRDKAADLAKSLASSDESRALRLANGCIQRFVFRFLLLRAQFPEIREREGKPDFADQNCFASALQDRISKSLHPLIGDSLKQSEDSEALDSYVSNAIVSSPADIASMSTLELDALMLKAILDHRVGELKDPLWSFRVHGLRGIEEQFLLLVDKYDSHHSNMIRSMCDRWGEGFLTVEEQTALALQNEDQRSEWLYTTVQERLKPLWFFFVSICRLLHKDEYWLTSEDAYWLGLIDEIIGRPDLANARMLVEYAP